MGTTGTYRPPIPSDGRLLQAGSGMRQIRTSKPDLLWLQGPGPVDFWTWTDPAGAIREQELTFFGRTIVRRNETLMTGLCHEGAGPMSGGRMGLLDFDRDLDGETLAAGDRILGAIPNCEEPAVADLTRVVRDALSLLGLDSGALTR